MDKKKKKKRYYTVGETIWLIADKVQAVVAEINKETYDVTVHIDRGETGEAKVVKMWEIDKLKFKAKKEAEKKSDFATGGLVSKETIVKVGNSERIMGIDFGTRDLSTFFIPKGGPFMKPDSKDYSYLTEGLEAFVLPDKSSLSVEQTNLRPPLFFAKVKDNAKIPKKAGREEAGYDVWACLENTSTEGEPVYELLLPKLKPTIIPTGIATCVDKSFYLNFANERGSTGKHAMLVLSGIVDSTYRGEVFINITPLYKDVLLTSAVDEIIEEEDRILYPYSKAICQMIDYRVGESEPVVITYEELKSIPSSRGDGIMGSSGH